VLITYLYAYYRKEVSSTCLCNPNILLCPSFPRLPPLPPLLFSCLDNDRLVLMSLQTPIPRKIGGGRRQRSGWFSLRKISFRLLLPPSDKKETITIVERSSSSLSCNCLIHCQSSSSYPVHFIEKISSNWKETFCHFL
jgi:hypothetical protein